RQRGRAGHRGRLERLAGPDAPSRSRSVRAAARGCGKWPHQAPAPGAEPPRRPPRHPHHHDGTAQVLAPSDPGSIDLKTRIAIRPCPVRHSEMLRQGGIHPVLARVFAARGLTDPRELASELQSLVPPGQLRHVDAAAVYLADAIAAGKKMTIVADYDCAG